MASANRASSARVDCRVQPLLVPLIQTGQEDCDHGKSCIIIFVGILSLDILYLEGKSPMLMRNIQVKLTWGPSRQKLTKALHSGIPP